MRLGVIRVNERRLASSAAILLIGGFVSGCSSDAMRFSYGTDGMFTGATANQRQIIAPNQPYPGDTVPAAAVDGSHTGSIARGAVTPVDLSPKPVSKSALAPVAGTSIASADSKPLVKLAQPAPHHLDTTTTGSVKSQASEADPVGWSRAGGTQVTAKEGESIYNLSRRFGVPANVLMKMNGITDGKSLQAGQKVIIPTYVYNSKAPVSAPDHDPKVAAAKSSKGEKLPTPKLPASGASQDKVAVLPKQPKLKEGEAAKPVETTAAGKAQTTKPVTDKVAATTTKPATAPAGTYTVASGDTLSKIA